MAAMIEIYEKKRTTVYLWFPGGSFSIIFLGQSDDMKNRLSLDIASANSVAE